MTSKRLIPLVALALLVTGTLTTPAFAAAELPDWVEVAPSTDTVFPPLESPRGEKAFGAVQPSIARRPTVLLETNFYVYGPGSAFGPNDVQLNVTVERRNFDAAVSLYLYWEDRVSGTRRYYNLPANGFVNNERDLFGTGNSPVAVLTPELGAVGGNGFQLFGDDGAFGPVPDSIPNAVGLYQFVFEVRSANGNQVVARGNALYSQINGVEQRAGNIGSSETWTNDNVYFLAAPVNVQNGATLTIEEGTVILGSQAGEGTLVIRQGAQIQAVGTDMAPIIMTSELEVGQRSAGDWGGLVINGFAPTNQQNPEGEGNSGPFGGNNANDSSGRLSYVRVEFAGIRFNDQNELNGIALQGVGRGTQIDHIQVHHNQDDGIEFFGGTVDAKYVLITDARDDSLDWTFGWNGRLQHFVALQRGNSHDHGIEADNFEDDPGATPQSSPQIYNGTWVGNGRVVSPSGDSDDGWQLRRGTAGVLSHCIVMGFANFGVVTASDNPADFADLTIAKTFFFDNEDGLSSSDEMAAIVNNAANQNQVDVSPLVSNGNSRVQPDIAPRNGSPARNVGATQPNDGFFDRVPYAGGVSPNDPWIDDGWTTFSDN